MEFFRRCPSCSKRFHARVSGEKAVGGVRERTVRKAKATTDVMVGNKYQPTSPAALEVDVPAVVEAGVFEVSYECERCGHAWSELKKR